MAAPFTEQNYFDMFTILQLSPDQLEKGSDLRDRGQYLENQDARTGYDLVGQTQQAIADYLTAQSAYNTAIEGDDALGLTSQSVSGEYSASFRGSAAASKYSNYLVAMRRNYLIIVRNMRWDKTSPYSGVVSRTIS